MLEGLQGVAMPLRWEVPPQNFDTTAGGLMTLFQIMFLDGWSTHFNPNPNPSPNPSPTLSQAPPLQPSAVPEGWTPCPDIPGALVRLSQAD